MTRVVEKTENVWKSKTTETAANINNKLKQNGLTETFIKKKKVKNITQKPSICENRSKENIMSIRSKVQRPVNQSILDLCKY